MFPLICSDHLDNDACDGVAGVKAGCAHLCRVAGNTV